MSQVSLETDVELLKRDVGNIEAVLTRLDSAIDKIADVSNGINKILAVHDSTIDGIRESFSERMNRQENDIEIIHDRISRHEDELKKDFREYHDEILKYGPLPLNAVETKINQWIAAKLAS